MRTRRNCPVPMAMVDPSTEIIQHIQSFLSRREAARTAILSKQWYTAWSTNGLLYLDPQGFCRTRSKRRGGGGLSIEFQNFATRSINRYKDTHLMLHELRLWMYIRKYDTDHDNEATARFYDKLILDALSLGVTVIALNVKANSTADYYYTLPPQVFNSVSLQDLSLYGQCRIDHLTATDQGTSICSRIVSLKLVQVKIGDDTFRDILLRCNLIKDLTLHDCKGLEEVSLSVARHNLKNLIVRHETRNYDFDDFDDVNDYKGRMYTLLTFGTEDDQYPNLISLELDQLEVDDLFSDNFSDRFPCLEKLKLRNYKCSGEAIQISSNSIKCLSLNQGKGNWFRRATIHLPKISNFNLTGYILSLDFQPPGPDHKWKSRVEVSLMVDDIWLRNILTELSSSEISLVINATSEKDKYYIFGDIQTINLLKVENLSIRFPLEYSYWRTSGLNCSETLCSLLFHCGPKFITPTFQPFKFINANRFLVPNYQRKEILYKTLKKNVNMKKCLQTIHGENCIHGLKEVQVEIYDQTLKAWKPHPNPNKTWTLEDEEDKIRFSLKWN